MIDKELLDSYYGTVVYDSERNKIGKLSTVYLDDRTDEPTFATVSTSKLVTSESFVPLRGARVDGSEVHVQVTKDQVKDAPSVEVGRDLTADDENRLYEYYQLDGGGTDAVGSARPAGPALEAERARLRKHDHRRGED